jgi:hypothetical protein
MCGMCYGAAWQWMMQTRPNWDGSWDTWNIDDDTCQLCLESTTEQRPFFTTQFEDYSVTEGFMLLMFVAIIIAVIHHFVRRFI